MKSPIIFALCYSGLQKIVSFFRTIFREQWKHSKSGTKIVSKAAAKFDKISTNQHEDSSVYKSPISQGQPLQKQRPRYPQQSIFRSASLSLRQFRDF
jgi:hypothetical protein